MITFDTVERARSLVRALQGAIAEVGPDFLGEKLTSSTKAVVDEAFTHALWQRVPWAKSLKIHASTAYEQGTHELMVDLVAYTPEGLDTVFLTRGVQ
jgi:hypothetical protein